MTTPLTLPELGEGITEAVVTRWLKEPGDRVDAGEPLVEVATDKVDTEIEAPVDGIVAELLIEENAVVEVGGQLAVIAHAGAPEPTEEAPAPPPAVEQSAAPAGVEEVEQPPVPAAAAVDDERPQRAETPSPDPEKPRTEKLTRLRQTIARRMVESLQVSAQLTTVMEVDVTEVSRLRTQHKEDFFARTGVKLSLLPFIAKATVEALAEHPTFNASVNADNTEVTYHSARHLGIAVDTPRGLMVPVVRDAERLGVRELAGAIADLADRCRTGKITPDELTGATFTLTNTGSRGALMDTPIINQPQTGILGTGVVTERLVPVPQQYGGHAIAVRSIQLLSISYDHRIVDGADAARFVTAIKARLEQADFDLGL